MGVRPHLYQMIGVNVSAIKNGEQWLDGFQKSHPQTDFLTVGKTAILSACSDEEVANELIEGYEEQCLEEVFQVASFINLDRELTFVGVLPIFQEDHSLYGNDLVYALIATRQLEDQPTVFQIPYVDYQMFLQQTKEELAQTSFSIHEKQEIVTYKGNWGRKYAYHVLDWFDEDLEFAYHFFQNNGLTVKRRDIQRYLVFEWC